MVIKDGYYCYHYNFHCVIYVTILITILPVQFRRVRIVENLLFLSWEVATLTDVDATRTAPRKLRNGSSHTCNMGKKRWQLLFLKSYSSGKYLHTSPGHRYLKLMYLKNRNHLLKFQRSTTTHFYTWKIKRKLKSSGREYHCTPYKSNCSILQQ